MLAARFTDQMGREVKVKQPPLRVISLVPSITEFLMDIGADVVGRTKFCIHPKEMVMDIPQVGGTKKFKVDTIKRLNPDLIVGNKEENYQDGIRDLERYFPVWMSNISTPDDQYQMMQSLGKLTGLMKRSEEIVREVKKCMAKLYKTREGSVLYLIWKNPWMAAGKKTYIDSILHHLGYENCLSESRYPELTVEQISDLKPDVILLSSEPFPFRKQHQEEIKSLCPDVKVELVDGQMFSWYGSRLLHL